ncbi:MAG: cytochrome c [Candidatus Acidiferrales bacterium]
MSGSKLRETVSHENANGISTNSLRILTRVVALEITAGLLMALMFFLVPAARAGDGQAATNGKAEFKKDCAACHGVDGSGNTPVGKSLKVADLRSAEIQKKSDAELRKVIEEGKNNMPSFKKTTTDEQIRALVAHIRTLASRK